jgi:hypothetical protein
MAPTPGFISRQKISRPDLPRTEWENNSCYYAMTFRSQSPGNCPATGEPLWYYVTRVNGPEHPPYRNEYIMDVYHFTNLADAEIWCHEQHESK